MMIGHMVAHCGRLKKQTRILPQLVGIIYCIKGYQALRAIGKARSFWGERLRLVAAHEEREISLNKVSSRAIEQHAAENA